MSIAESEFLGKSTQFNFFSYLLHRIHERLVDLTYSVRISPERRVFQSAINISKVPEDIVFGCTERIATENPQSAFKQGNFRFQGDQRIIIKDTETI